MKSKILNYAFKPGLPQEFEIIEMDQLYKEFSETLTKPHRTGFYHILWFQNGNPVHLVDFNPVQVQPDTVIFLNKDTVHKFDDQGKFNGKVILFTENFFIRTEADLKYLRSNVLFNDLFTVSRIYLKDVKQMFEQTIKLIEAELSNPGSLLQSEIIKNLLHTLLLLSERERKGQNLIDEKRGADLDYVILFKDQVEQNYKKLKTVSSYAENLSVTERRLNTATSKVLGKSPKQLIDDRVMLEAKRLLAHTSNNVKEIGFDLGFEEPTNFIKYFKKHHDVTPVEFRESFNSHSKIIL
jgi:AraC family transcriptional activator of pobA